MRRLDCSMARLMALRRHSGAPSVPGTASAIRLLNLKRPSRRADVVIVNSEIGTLGFLRAATGTPRRKPWLEHWLETCRDLSDLRATHPMMDAVIDEIDGRMIRIGDQWLADFASCNY